MEALKTVMVREKRRALIGTRIGIFIAIIRSAAFIYYILNQNIWASQVRTPEILTILVSYGVHAKSAIPKLKEAAEIFDKGQGDFPQHMSVAKAEAVRKAIADIEAATHNPKLRRLR